MLTVTKMATLKKPAIIGNPLSRIGSAKQTTIVAPNKPLKPDTVLRKSPAAPAKTTSLTSKPPAKPVITKMAPVKPVLGKPVVSPKSSPVKLTPAPAKPVAAKVKRMAADSSSSEKEPKPVRKLSIPLTKPGAKVTTEPKVKPTATPSAPAKPIKPAEAKLPARRPTSIAPAKPTKPVTVAKAAPKETKSVAAKAAIKTAKPVLKPVSIRTPVKKVIKKCTEVQICDADSTSTDQMHEFPAAPEFNEIQAYKVAEQMMEVLGTAVVTNQVVPEPMETVVLESPAGADKADADLAEGEQADCEPSDLSEEIVVDVCQDSVGDNAEILWSTRAEEGDRVGAAEIGGATANGALSLIHISEPTRPY